jgi:CRP-like cAMP-binding protein
MSEFRFERIFDADNMPRSTVVVTTDSEGLENVVDSFRDFLLACGYHPDSVKSYFEPDMDSM